jgi:hypothetical protein
MHFRQAHSQGLQKLMPDCLQDCEWLWLEHLWEHGRWRSGLGDPYAGSVGASVILEQTAYRGLCSEA